MIVTGVTELTKNRSRVYIENEFAFVLYKGEIRMYNIKAGEELSQETYDLILYKILPKRAKLRAMNLLTKRDYTEQKLREKLSLGGYPESVIEEAVSCMRKYHYVDDEKYALSYIMSVADKRSHRRIEIDLARKGISNEIIRKAFQIFLEEGGDFAEEELIHNLLLKRKYDANTANEKDKLRNYAYLVRKGFDCENAKRAIYGRSL